MLSPQRYFSTFLLSLLVFCLFGSPSLLSVRAEEVQETQASSELAEESAQAVESVPSTVNPIFYSPNKILLLDDFSLGRMTNLLGGLAQGDEEFPGGCYPSFVAKEEDVFGGSGKSMRLEYDVAVTNSFSYYWSQLGPGVGDAGVVKIIPDLTEFRYLSFWIKTDQIMPRFILEIHQDVNGDGLFVLGVDKVDRLISTRYLTSEDPNVWRKVVVPLSHFRQIEDWSRIIEIVVVFENKLRSDKGVLYLDDILWGSANLEELNLHDAPDWKDVVEGLEVDGESFPLSQTQIEQLPSILSVQLKRTLPTLEAIFLDVSEDQGQHWRTVLRNYLNTTELRYEFALTELPTKNILLRLSGRDVLGRNRNLMKPIQIGGQHGRALDSQSE